MIRKKLFSFVTSIIILASTLPSYSDIKIGILHSLSGTMAISETTLKDTMLMLIEKPVSYTHLTLPTTPYV